MIKRFVNRWAEFVVNQRVLVIILSVLTFAALIVPMKNLYFDNSNEMWFLEGDDSLKEYAFLRETFGSSQGVMIGVKAREGEDTVITKENLQTIHEISNFLEDHEMVTKVSSLSKYQYMTSEDDTLTTEDLVEDFDELADLPEEEIRRMVEIMKGETLSHDFLISKDLKHTIILARNIYKQGTIDHHIKLLNDLRAFIDENKYAEKGYEFHLAGEPYISKNFLDSSIQDQSTTLPLMLLLIAVILFVSFRSFQGLTMPWLVIIGSVIVIMGAMGIFGWAFTSINITLPILLMAVGIGDSVHIIVEFYHFGSEGMNSKDAAKQSVRELFIPCFNTTITTFIGFIALSSTRLNPIREYGYAAAVGVMAAFFISVTLLPAILSFVSSKKKKTDKMVKHGLVARITQKLTPFTWKYHKTIVSVSAVFILISVAFASQIEVDTNFMNNFKKNSEIRQNLDYFEDVYNGGLNLEIIIDSGEKDGIKDPKFLNQVLKFQDYLESLELTGKSNSAVNYIRQMNKTLHNGDPAYYAIPETKEHVAQYLFLYSTGSPEEDLSDLKSFDERYLRVTLRFQNITTARMVQMVETIRQELAVNYPELKVTFTGDMMLFNSIMKYTQQGMVSSFSIAIVAIVLCFFVLLRSIKYGLLALIPSLTPILASGGIMGLLGITLDMSTMMVAAVTFGIAVDDTIHVMVRFIKAKEENHNTMEAVHLAMTESGRAVVFTSIILFLGFSTLLLSSFVPNIYYGLFGGIILLGALVAVLVLLPSVIFLLKGKEVQETHLAEIRSKAA